MLEEDFDIIRELNRLLRFALSQGLIAPEDETWAANSLIGALGLPSFQTLKTDEEGLESPAPLLAGILDWAAEQGLIEDTPTERDLLDTRLMGILTPRPSEVARRFEALRREDPVRATDEFYRLGVASNYIRSDRTAKNICWKAKTEYGELDITVNLSKPEKDPRDIARARNVPASGYPSCLLCRENEGYFGHAAHPARQNLRLVPLELAGRRWYLQYSPYSYYNEHCIILNERHLPMKISRETFENLLAFLDVLPHYFAGSNADLPIVGGSILSHDHYQGGRYVFAMDRAPVEKEYPLARGVLCGRLKWPMSALRLSGREKGPVIELACRVLEAWRGYSDPSVNVLAESGGEPHNTVTPIARMKGGAYELDLVLRNNRRSEEHPLGIFHPHAAVHHIKKENIGLIEVMGLAVLPPRLAPALSELEAAWKEGEEDLSRRPGLALHDAWYQGLRKKHPDLAPEAAGTMLRDEVGLVFAEVLRDAGVFKRDPEGTAAFDRFVGVLD